MEHLNNVEQSILDCWHVVDDLDIVFEACCEGEDMTKDRMANLVLGLHELYQLKFDKLFRQFEKLIAVNREQVELIQAHQNEKLFAAMDAMEARRDAKEDARVAAILSGRTPQVKTKSTEPVVVIKGPPKKKSSTKKGKKNV